MGLIFMTNQGTIQSRESIEPDGEVIKAISERIVIGGIDKFSFAVEKIADKERIIPGQDDSILLVLNYRDKRQFRDCLSENYFQPHSAMFRIGGKQVDGIGEGYNYLGLNVAVLTKGELSRASMLFHYTEGLEKLDKSPLSFAIDFSEIPSPGGSIDKENKTIAIFEG